MFNRQFLFAGIFAFSGGAIFSGDVLPNGSYQYSVEIISPPGTNGMQPKLSLQYNSGGGNGMLGVGWTLQGLPNITRIDNGSGINFNGTDTYVGPGGKLVDISGSRTLFHTVTEDLSKFEPAYGDCGIQSNEPCSWIMTDTSGTRYFFGSSSNSRQVGANGIFIAWLIDKVMDSNGNFYTVEYDQDSGEVYPTKIIYTQNEGSGIGYYRSIEFAYDTNRTDHFPNYSYNTNIETKWRIADITVKTDIFNIFGLTVPLTGSQVRRYHLSYSNGIISGKSRLSSIQEFGTDDVSSLPAQNFTWTDGSVASSGLFNFPRTVLSSLATNIPIAEYVLTGDFNGDGKLDIVASTSGATPGSGWCVQHGNGGALDAKQCMTGGLIAATASGPYPSPQPPGHIRRLSPEIFSLAILTATVKQMWRVRAMEAVAGVLCTAIAYRLMRNSVCLVACRLLRSPTNLSISIAMANWIWLPQRVVVIGV